MAEIKGIDVSRWNGNIDWKTVANYGMGFAILRITEKGNVVDSTFETNYKGCTENKIPVGVYKYSYATNVSQIKEEANIVIKTLKSRKLDYPVFLDIEDKCQENISKDDMLKMIKAFRSIVVKAGYKFGIYCGAYWYKTKLPEEAKKYDCWLATYPSNDDGTLQERVRPSNGIGWQYSSKATIPGIQTKVDRNIFYKDYSKSSSNPSNNSSSTSNNSQGGNTMSNNIIQKIINDAVDYAVGIANDNSHGYSQATRSLYNITNPKSFDCSSLVLTSYYYAFVKNGLSKQAQYLKGNCSYTGNMMKMLNCGFEVVATNQTAHSKMQKGDIELNITYHTAMAIDKDRIVHARSSEGTSDTKDNSGNEIRVQGWYLYSHGWDKRLRFTGKGIDFSNISSAPSSPTSTLSKPTVSTGNQLIKDAQTHLNNFINARLVCDGIYGTATKKAFIKALQLSLNKDMKLNLSVDGILGTNTKKALKSVILKNKSKGYIVTILEIGMLLNNINPNGVECPGIMGHGLVSAVKQYQKNKGLVQDGIVGINTWKSLCK